MGETWGLETKKAPGGKGCLQVGKEKLEGDGETALAEFEWFKALLFPSRAVDKSTCAERIERV